MTESGQRYVDVGELRLTSQFQDGPESLVCRSSGTVMFPALAEPEKPSPDRRPRKTKMPLVI